MKPEAQRKAIAKACGWEVWNDEDLLVGLKRGVHQPDDGPHIIPDYLNDLNAMREALKTLTFDEQMAFDKHLAEIAHVTFSWLASAAQQAEAFLKTKGLWTEQPKETQ